MTLQIHSDTERGMLRTRDSETAPDTSNKARFKEKIRSTGHETMITQECTCRRVALATSGSEWLNAQTKVETAMMDICIRTLYGYNVFI